MVIIKKDLIIAISSFLTGCLIAIFIINRNSNNSITESDEKIIRSQERVKGLEIQLLKLSQRDSILEIEKDSLNKLLENNHETINNTIIRYEKARIDILNLDNDSAFKFFSTKLSEADTL